MAVTIFPIIPGPAYVRIFPRPSPYRRFPTAAPTITILATAYTTTTLSTLRTRVRERLLSTFWSDAELDAYINEGLRVWNTLTGYWRITTSANIGQGVMWWSMADNIGDHLAPLRFELVDSHLEVVSLHQLDELNPAWQADTAGTLTKVATVGLDNIALNPTLAADTTVIFEIIRKAPILTADDDYVQMGEEDIIAIIDYAHFVCALKEGTSELQTAYPNFQRFLAHAASYNSRLAKLSVYRQLLGLGGQTQTRPAGETLSPHGKAK